MTIGKLKFVIGVFVVMLGASLAASAQTRYFVCGAGTEVRADFSNEMKNVRIRFGMQDVKLKLGPSAEGWNYVAKETTFWVNGREAKITTTELKDDCKPEGSDAAVNTIKYLCDGNVDLTAEFFDGDSPKVSLRHGSENLSLPLAGSGTGTRYEESGAAFWTKGKNATLESKALNAKCVEK